MSFSVTLAQINSIIGNVDANTQMIQKSIQQAIKADSDLIIFPECALTGYPLYDLTQHPSGTNLSLPLLTGETFRAEKHKPRNAYDEEAGSDS